MSLEGGGRAPGGISGESRRGRPLGECVRFIRVRDRGIVVGFINGNGVE
jgi:hypothetical protein